MITSLEDVIPKFQVEITDFATENDILSGIEPSTSLIYSNKTQVVELFSQSTISITEALPINFVAAVYLIAFKLVTTDEAGKAIYADANNLAHVHSVFGVAVTSAAINALVTVKRDGIISNTGWNWTPKQFLYLGLNGDITPSQVGRICVPIGYAINATDILLNIHIGTIRG